MWRKKEWEIVGTYHSEHVHEEMRIFAEDVEGMATVVDEELELLTLAIAAVNDVSHVWRQHERSAIALDASKHLRVAEELSEVDVEEVTAVSDHDVVVVAITNTENVCRYTVTCARCREVAHSLKKKRNNHWYTILKIYNIG